MYHAVQKIRVAAIVIGCCIILASLFYQGTNYALNLNQYLRQGAPALMLASTLIFSVMSSFIYGTLIILIALLINPEKIAPFFDKHAAVQEAGGGEARDGGAETESEAEGLIEEAAGDGAEEPEDISLQ